MDGNGYNISYKYNPSGIRTEKEVNGVVTKYHLEDDEVTFEENGKDKIHYTYDLNDNLISMNLNGQEYYYIRNAQNDIIALNNSRGTTVATYTYDSWGKLLSIKDENGTDITNNKDHVGYKNPYRYRGYRYDTETGLYYLNSRYYNSEWGRFVSSDEIVGETGTLLSCNMFAYCSNDPINNEDPDGDIAWWIGAAIGGAAFDTAMYLFQHRNGGFTWRGLGKAAATGAITGVLFAGAGKVIGKIIMKSISKGVKLIKHIKKIRRLKKLKMNLQLFAKGKHITSQGARNLAEKLGFKKTNFKLHGQPVF
ncbi:RHS repeat domain-containing protein [Clostridium novyi]|nr:RHS repeat-associated core domain-containing protein [Clostridium novyi]